MSKRDKKVKEKLKFNRENRIKEKKVERETQRLEYKSRKRIQPIINDADKLKTYQEIQERRSIIKAEKMLNDDIKETETYLKKAKNSNMSTSAIETLEKNYQILLQLKEDFLKEQENRNNLNIELEEKGLEKISEKIDYIGKTATN